MGLSDLQEEISKQGSFLSQETMACSSLLRRLWKICTRLSLI